MTEPLGDLADAQAVAVQQPDLQVVVHVQHPRLGRADQIGIQSKAMGVDLFYAPVLPACPASLLMLIAKLKRLYAHDPDVRVFHKGDERDRVDFGLNELLYDVCVCRTAPCSSARHGKVLRYVTRALSQVESEFARDSSEALKAFNKLVIGATDNKLFVGPRLTDPPKKIDDPRDVLRSMSSSSRDEA